MHSGPHHNASYSVVVFLSLSGYLLREGAGRTELGSTTFDFNFHDQTVARCSENAVAKRNAEETTVLRFLSSSLPRYRSKLRNLILVCPRQSCLIPEIKVSAVLWARYGTMASIETNSLFVTPMRVTRYWSDPSLSSLIIPGHISMTTPAKAMGRCSLHQTSSWRMGQAVAKCTFTPVAGAVVAVETRIRARIAWLLAADWG